MDWRDIPSLAALRAFEAAARTASLSAAARELNVTHAAIAQHVRTLESRFDGKLLTRDGQRMMTTPGGARLAEALTDAFARVARGVEALDDERRARPLRVTVTPSFAANWLMPRLARFWARHPEIDVELMPSIRLVDLDREQIDLAIRYGQGDWPGVEATRLMDSGLTAVAKPGVTDPHLTSGTFLLERISTEEARHWLAARGIDIETRDVRYFSSIELSRQAAIAGLGIALLPRLYLGDSLESGALQALAGGDAGVSGYYVARRQGPAPEAVSRFADWLQDEIAAA